MNFRLDCYGSSVPKYGEPQCGDITRIIKNESTVHAVLADGMGSGIRANLLATMTVKMLSSLLERGADAAAAAESVASNLPLDDKRGIRYTAFTIVEVKENGLAKIVGMNMPSAVILRREKLYPYKEDTMKDGRNTLKYIQLQLRHEDTIAVFSDGIVNAGTGGCLGAGWQNEAIASYLGSAYKPGITAEKLTKLLLNVGSSLYLDKPGDDMSTVIIRAFRHKG